ncbi:MAG: LuxR C-terminal-related transcriptional regulator [Chloroflexota bacterium]|nr:LuxR C-terminal-related transcriptional regulator [Chloroflexota bacterium]
MASRADRTRGTGAPPRRRGLSNRQIGHELFISPKTADHHIQHIYAKIGVSTRAGAAIFAMEHDLIHEDSPGK